MSYLRILPKISQALSKTSFLKQPSVGTTIGGYYTASPDTKEALERWQTLLKPEFSGAQPFIMPFALYRSPRKSPDGAEQTIAFLVEDATTISNSCKVSFGVYVGLGNSFRRLGGYNTSTLYLVNALTEPGSSSRNLSKFQFSTPPNIVSAESQSLKYGFFPQDTLTLTAAETRTEYQLVPILGFTDSGRSYILPAAQRIFTKEIVSF